MEDACYTALKPGPDTLIGADERYRAGWFERFDGDFNFQDTRALPISFQGWVHLSLDTPEHFIVLNLADLGKAGQTALLVADKQSRAFRHAAETRMFGRNQVVLSDSYRRFQDGATHSMVATDASHQHWRFSVHAEDVHLVGTATRVGGPPLTQVTRFQRMRGSLQRFGNLAIEHAVLSIGDRVIPIPSGTLGTFDHTVGHQRGLQNWNWLAAVGMARCHETGEESLLGVQVAKDRPLARPVVQSQKYAVWVNDQLFKIPSAHFSYGYTDAEAKETGPWRIHSTEEGTDPARWLDLHFQPHFHRRERRSVVLVDADFNQYYGDLSGRVRAGGKTWIVEDFFAVCEESLLEL